MTTRVYKFLSGRYGILNLRNHRLKLSTIDDLNDPFDLYSIDTTDPTIAQAVTATIVDFKADRGLLCFSRNWDNLLMWSHYGDSHTGLCLGFDIPDDPAWGSYDMDVRYQPNLLQIRSPEDLNYDFANRWLRTKHESWSYEQEVRIFVALHDPPDEKGLLWFEFGENLQLKEVIIGAQCRAEDSAAVAEALASYSEHIDCSFAYMRADAFLLVRSPAPHVRTFRPPEKTARK